MTPNEIGLKYNKIAQWWHERHHESSYGLVQLKKALGFVKRGKTALDIGCGAGGRFIRVLDAEGFVVTGLDVSSSMIKIAEKNHHLPHQFIHQDICTWETEDQFDLMIAWDSIFHLPFEEHEKVISKCCRLLNRQGVLMYTFGHDYGEHTDTWHEDTFYYSSIGINNNIRCLIQHGLTILHVELDQFPENHVYVIAIKD